MKIIFYLLLFFLPVSISAKIDYIIGYDPSWYPVDLKEKTPQVNAFVNELFVEIGKRENVDFCLAEISWSTIFEDIEKKKIDGIVSFFEPTMISEKIYDFSDPFLLIGPVLIVPAYSEAKSLNDLEGKTVGISLYNDSILIVQKHPEILMKHYDNMTFALSDLHRGQIDGVLMNRLEAEGLITAFYQDTLKIVTPPLNERGLRLLVLKGKHPNLITFFNSTLKDFQIDNTYQKLLNEYGVAP